ncbi:helix-turn-helix domain-containing protein [Sphingomonas sp. TREG-RG-20F-R18-01]|uniref:helix-turn-helix domain-containing protein n=1 Tax=Sphingomonas sp. TREG-RG-20F-R18-01 TaxID=2914982 RepID=UPI001F5A8C0F|nr:helix-turn-helix domain-containing protein [Sphingomonas sp. TREG-RG-20F-R18-01]
MTDPLPPEEATLFPKTAGERLREAREALGLSLAEVAARTRIPVRQLEAIEESNFAALPSITYSVGFAKAYARAVGVDEVAIGRDIRGTVDKPSTPRRTEYQTYEIVEPSRGPTRGLAFGALIAAVILLIGAGLWYGTALFRSEESAPAVSTPVANTVPVAAPPTAPIPTSRNGPVVLTATDEVWLKVYDAAGKTLYIGTLKSGEAYTVPGDAVGPMINVGRPDKLRVTVGGQPIAPLGDGKRAIKDVKVDPAALIARGVATPGSTAPAIGNAADSPQRSASQHAVSSTGAALNIAAPAAVAPEPSTPSTGATPAP